MKNEIKKLCALTFDDGPDSTMTARVLDKLEAHGITATFMQVGCKITEENRSTEERIVAGGHEIGNHSWEHRSFTEMTGKEIAESIGRTDSAIEAFTGKKPAFFRPPNLAYDERVLESAGKPAVGGLVAFDWDSCGTTAEQRAENVISKIRDGDIILMHDVQPEPHPTPEALDIIIPELKARGFEFLTLSELFEAKGTEPFGKMILWNNTDNINEIQE